MNQSILDADFSDDEFLKEKPSFRFGPFCMQNCCVSLRKAVETPVVVLLSAEKSVQAASTLCTWKDLQRPSFTVEKEKSPKRSILPKTPEKTPEIDAEFSPNEIVWAKWRTKNLHYAPAILLDLSEWSGFEVFDPKAETWAYWFGYPEDKTFSKVSYKNCLKFNENFEKIYTEKGQTKFYKKGIQMALKFILDRSDFTVVEAKKLLPNIPRYRVQNKDDWRLLLSQEKFDEIFDDDEEEEIWETWPDEEMACENSKNSSPMECVDLMDLFDDKLAESIDNSVNFSDISTGEQTAKVSRCIENKSDEVNFPSPPLEASPIGRRIFGDLSNDESAAIEPCQHGHFDLGAVLGKNSTIGQVIVPKNLEIFEKDEIDDVFTFYSMREVHCSNDDDYVILNL